MHPRRFLAGQLIIAGSAGAAAGRRETVVREARRGLPAALRP
ncbi:hypothetical protein [Rhizocola hellebori]|nr:hypothetical protein [Rhizocola hellebori]